MISAIAIDDEPKAIEVIKHHALKIDFLKLLACFYDPKEAISFLKHNPVDLVFIDINMPEMSGLEMLDELKIKPFIVFTTAYAEFALKSYEYEAIDYLLKPIEFDRFLISVHKTRNQIALRKSEEPFFFIKDGFKNLKIVFDEIQFIKGCGNYLDIVTTNKTHSPRMTFFDIIMKLSPTVFVRTHNSYIVNINKIDKIENNQVYIEEHKIPISSKYRDALFHGLNL